MAGYILGILACGCRLVVIVWLHTTDTCDCRLVLIVWLHTTDIGMWLPVSSYSLAFHDIKSDQKSGVVKRETPLMV